MIRTHLDSEQTPLVIEATIEPVILNGP